jgi:hypothetical protein
MTTLTTQARALTAPEFQRLADVPPEAQWFANRFEKAGVVLEKVITKQDAVALFIGRSESEVVVI